jgi:hypothetical protein
MPKCSYSPCSKDICFILNPKTNKLVPVDADSMTNEELKAFNDSEVVVCYNPVHHVSHFKTCLNPNLFSKRKG